MMRGSVPLLTKGPFALFLGGDKMFDILGDGTPGKAARHLIIFTIIFQIIISVYKRYKNKKLERVTYYAQNLRRSLVENVLNIYGLVLILFSSTITLIGVLRQATNI